jgi:DNA-binding NtrC family response regulator
MYRLKVFQIQLPPLQARIEDIPILAQHFLGELARRYGRTTLSLDDSALSALTRHDWPGNVRELRNVLERAVLLQRHGILSASDLVLGKPPPITLAADAAAVSAASSR